MRLLSYPIEENIIFKDPDHPQLIKIKHFQSHNQKVFHEFPYREIEAKMPDNPKWMSGARSCSAIAQAICQKYQTEIIIPSDSNIAHGMARQELRKVAINGDMSQHMGEIMQLQAKLKQGKIQVCLPDVDNGKQNLPNTQNHQNESGITSFEIRNLSCIDEADALVICNPGGEIGLSSGISIGYAYSQNKRIIFTEKPKNHNLGMIPSEVGDF